MPPSNSTQTTNPPPQQNGKLPDSVNPFYLAIAELQADTDDLNQASSPAAAAEAPSRQTIAPTQPVRALGLGSLAAIGGIALVGGLIGGMIASRGLNARPSQPAGHSADSTPSAHHPIAQELEDQKSRAGELAKRVDRSDEALAALSKSIPPSEFARLRGQVDELSKTAGRLAPVETRVQELDRHDDQLSDEVRSVRADLLAIRQKLDALEGLVKARTTSPASTPRRDESTGNQRSMNQGAELFRKGLYKEALGVFNKLELSNPDDARVWYFAALSHGFVTQHWEGGTAELVQKGIERERAGTPDRAQIDAAFKDLTESTGKVWLEGYRKLVNENAAQSAK